MESLQNRIDSFAKARRVKNPAKPSSSISLKWPHPSTHFVATPTTLAEAGFYFSPSFDDRDNVTCFMCEKQLSDWEVHDDPFNIHWDKCGDNCCWAIVRCGLRGDMDEDGGFIFPDKSRLPAAKLMERARLETFFAGDGWIHDQGKNHGASSRKMARAGFVFTPQHAGDDLATCLYCHVSLSGWDTHDDPTEEHRKRHDKSGTPCPFFSIPKAASPSKPPSRAQSQPQSKPASKHARSTSTSNSKPNDLILPMKTHDGDGDGEDQGSEADAPQARRSTTKRARAASASASKGKTPKKKLTRSQSRAGLKDVVEDAEEAAEDDDDAEQEQEVGATRVGRAKQSLATRTQSRSKSVSRSVKEAEEEEEVVVEKTNTRLRSRSRTKAPTPTPTPSAEEEEVKVLKRSTRGKAAARVVVEEEVRVRKKSIRGRAASRVVEEIDDEEEGQAEEDKVKVLRKSTRARTPLRSAVEESKDAPVPRKPSRTKKSKAPAPAVVEPESEAEDFAVEEEQAAEVKKPEPKPRQRSRSKAKTPATRKPSSRAKPKAAALLPEETAEEGDSDGDGEETQAELEAETELEVGPTVDLDVEEEREALPPSPAAPAPVVVEKKKRTASSSSSSAKPASVTSAKPPAPLESKATKRARAAVRDVEEKEQDQGRGTPADQYDDDDDIDVFVSLSASPVPALAPVPLPARYESEQPQEHAVRVDGVGMEPLFVPKRSAKSAVKLVDVDADVDVDMEMDVDADEAAREKLRPGTINKTGKASLAQAQVGGKEKKPTKRKEGEKGKEESTGVGGGRNGTGKEKTRKASSLLKVVEISTDEGDDEDQEDRANKTRSSERWNGTKPVRKASQSKEPPLPRERAQVQAPGETVHVVKSKPPKPKSVTSSRPPSSPPPACAAPSEDIEMAIVEPDAAGEGNDTQLHEDPPRTPPRSTPTLNVELVSEPVDAPESLPMPALSKLPFTPLQNLTDAELDMTVEEWIRYQMEVEYDKFRRDGKRELGRFKKRAEEVKGIIERL
ncbi:hypothetical protein D9615_001913 [Tricholomella constricta]|uniref:BIR-domain-containing protein n=1 Tax=Tricholomella constricta TaxID=117010 RepID=A0A8H5HPA6_9AGAR|nr:hypothetical protein D9615_001913 [Tricholomella constricta]